MVQSTVKLVGWKHVGRIVVNNDLVGTVGNLGRVGITGCREGLAQRMQLKC